MIVAYVGWAVAFAAHAVLYYKVRVALDEDSGLLQAAQRADDGNLGVFAAMFAVYVMFWMWCAVSAVNAKRVTGHGPGLAKILVAAVFPLGLVWWPLVVDQSQVLTASSAVATLMWISMAIGIRAVRACLHTVDMEAGIARVWGLALAAPYFITYFANKVSRGGTVDETRHQRDGVAHPVRGRRGRPRVRRRVRQQAIGLSDRRSRGAAERDHVSRTGRAVLA